MSHGLCTPTHQILAVTTMVEGDTKLLTDSGITYIIIQEHKIMPYNSYTPFTRGKL